MFKFRNNYKGLKFDKKNKVTFEHVVVCDVAVDIVHLASPILLI